MKINRKELLEVLTKIKPALADEKSAIEQGRYFIFDKNIIYTFNDEIAITQNFKSDISGAIEAKKFYELLQKIKSDEIDITVKDDKEVIIKNGKTKAGIKFDPEINIFPLDTKDLEFNRLPRKFIDGIKFSVFSASKDIAKFPLNCLSINGKSIVSCDNFRLTNYNLDREIKESFLIDAVSAVHLTNHDIIKYCVTDEWLHFRDKDNITISCRQVNGDFPDVSHLLDVEGDIIEFPEGLSESIMRAKIMQDEMISIEIYEGKLTCKAKGESGWIEESSDIDYKGEGISFDVSPDFLKEVLALTRTGIVSENSLLFEDENFKHVLALLVNEDG
jgi:DNA polymerase III sliding clamp (beta) subunit (PCNA family)